MMQDGHFSTEQMSAVLDNAPVAAYVSALDDWELLYANRLARTLFLREPDSRGITCYQAAGFDEPCPFCRVGSISRLGLSEREFHHPVNQRVYQLSGKIIDWAGKPAHIEYITDITEKKKEEELSRNLEEELRTMFISIPCGLCVYRFDGKGFSPLFHNQAFYEIMGYSKEHICSVEKVTNFLGVHPEDEGLLRKKIQETILSGEILSHTYRVWNDREKEYHWIRLAGSVRGQEDGTKILYAVYSDVSQQKILEKGLTESNEKMQDIVNAIPGGVAIYRVSDIFETVYFSDGVPELSGYTVEEYRKLAGRNAAEMTYWEDTEMVISKAREVIASKGVADFEFRKQHRDGHIVWVRVQVKWIGEDGGYPLLHCVFHNISDLKEAQLEMNHLVNSIPGGIASYRVEKEQFIPTFFSDGAAALSGHSRKEIEELGDIFQIIYEMDRERVLEAAKAAFVSGEVLDISYRTRHKNGNLIWIHLYGRRIGPLSESARFYAVFTGMSEEARLFQNIANETADGIYVIDRANYDLLYVNESKELFAAGPRCLGRKCYEALHGKGAPCDFCTLKSGEEGEELEMEIQETGRVYKTRFRQTDWNGIPAYVKYVRDATEEVRTRREKERLELYFKNVVDELPGGIAVIRCNPDDTLTPEFISRGFAAMICMEAEDAAKLCGEDIFPGICPDDIEENREKLLKYMEAGEGHCELNGRMKRGDGGSIWVRCVLSLQQTADGVRRLYAVYTDVSRAMEEKEQLRRRYEELLIQHYRSSGPNELILGHCNITQNRIMEIIDHSDSGLLKTFGTAREEFFMGLAGFVENEKERQAFLNMYLNEPSLNAFKNNETELSLKCFVKLPREEKGRYVQFKVNMVETPDTGDVTGILTVTDITEQTISDQILHRLSVTGYDFVVELDLDRDRYKVLTFDESAEYVPQIQGCHSERMAYMLRTFIVPKDREQYRQGLDPDRMRRRLEKEGLYTFPFSVTDKNGDIRTKNMTVSAIDLRLGRVCLLRTDITDSVREQQGMLNIMAYTFEIMGFINTRIKSLTMYTRRTVLENLPPYEMENYDDSVDRFTDSYVSDEGREEVRRQFRLENMLTQLSEKPAGYDFVFPYRTAEGLRYKQLNVLWGDQNCSTVCLVRADVTDMLAVERETKTALETALEFAKEANRAKSDFLSAMSHDIRTPMNAIMGMTALAVAHSDDRERVSDCLQKISVSSKHLLSLINDVLDMSRIERSQITLSRKRLSLSDLVGQLSDMMAPQAKEAGLQFHVRKGENRHEYFYGDSLRINQILINILSNAIKFTPKGGSVDFLAEEAELSGHEERVCYRFTVSDTGIGMTEEFLSHIFEPFARGSDAAHIEGTGLGLSIAKSLVELMEGRISVKSRSNEGTVFCVELEFEAAKDEGENLTNGEEAVSPGREELFAGRLFLVAEDNEINSEILCELLAMYGAKAVVRTDGAQTVQAFEEAAPGTYDAILMDIRMPKMNGYEATRAIRRLERADAKTVPIIAMTANAFAEDIDEALAAGMDAHVAKPIDLDLLKSALSRAFGGHFS